MLERPARGTRSYGNMLRLSWRFISSVPAWRNTGAEPPLSDKEKTMSSSGALDQVVGHVVGTLPNGIEYRQVLLNPNEGEKHVTPDGREWEAVRESVVEGKVVPSPFTIHWRAPSGTAVATHFKLTTLFVE
jgi:hypothetical protein